MSSVKNFVSKNRFPLFYIVAGAIAFYYSFLILVGKIDLLMNADQVLPCSVNIFIDCGTVMKSWQASLFGFPNPILGVAGFSIILTIGFSILSGFRPKKWFWGATSIGLFLATIFVYWLFYQAVFSIGALCPYCIIVWVCTLPLFIFTIQKTLKSYEINLKNWHTAVMLTFLYGVIIGAIIWKFWDYWMTVF